jgi:hypothetical protein
MFVSGPWHDQQLFERIGRTSRLKTMVLASAGADKGVPADIPAAIINARHARWLGSRSFMREMMRLSAFRVNLCEASIWRMAFIW